MESHDLRHSQMNSCREMAMRNFAREISLVNSIEKLYAEMIEKIGNVQDKSAVLKANFVLAVRSFRLLQCARDHIMNGYYEVSMILLRCVYEDFIQMKYFTKHANDAGSWLAGKKVTQSGMRNELVLPGELYKMMSEDFSHPNRVGCIKPIMSDIVDQKASINHYPIYAANYCKYNLVTWILYAWNSIQLVLTVTKNDLIVDKKWITKMQEWDKVMWKYVAECSIEAKVNAATATQQKQPTRSS